MTTLITIMVTALLAVLTRAQPLKPAQFMALMTLYNETGRFRCCEPVPVRRCSLCLIFVCAGCPGNRCTRFSATSSCVVGARLACNNGDVVRLDLWECRLQGTITSLIGLFTRLQYLYGLTRELFLESDSWLETSARSQPATITRMLSRAHFRLRLRAYRS